ncbi:DUF2809 domain-containing protein [Paenibacillus silvae]|uniref:ribosomal maturation YjgA family protein n=1 Tax=Paenibacillus silvae TaxID=1325358 RepID=UPI00200516F7|nr:DUF2809 domain-containing protein [Paenibacillus silvae]MCK6077153.1 DUF2809 domain-containing protein [Paenibacillus silvae]MCK6151350.1 DUF2809 domain-containing protein [Paenibacillus silvae]MCK6269839.1 DUF2809 domain-containing protein [Paenibacillus silvae]
MNRVLVTQRCLYLVVVIITMAAGLASRAYGAVLPDFVREHFGDALWAGMIYYGIRMVCIQWSRARAVLISVIFSWSIEFSQMIQVPWLTELRSTLWGALILGHGFLVVDLIRYLIGIGCVYLLDRFLLSKILRL